MIMLTDIGALKMLQAYFNSTALTLRLYTNDSVPTDTDSPATHTEAAGGGYAPIVMPAGSFACSIQNGIAQAAHPSMLFSFSGALMANPDIYGYFVTDGSGDLIFADRRAEKYTPLSAGDTLSTTPLFQLSKGTPT